MLAEHVRQGNVQNVVKVNKEFLPIRYPVDDKLVIVKGVEGENEGVVMPANYNERGNDQT